MRINPQCHKQHIFARNYNHVQQHPSCDKKGTLHPISLPKETIVINMVITKVIMPYVIMVELSLLPNSCITTYPTTFVLAPPLKLSATQHMED
jgi:hypothetical protein